MKRRYGLVSLLSLLAALATAPLSAAPPEVPANPVTKIDLGKSVTAEVGKKIVLTADTAAKKVTWRIPAGCDALPLDGKRLAVWAPPGTYLFTAMAPSGDDVVSAEVVLTVTGPRPPPPPPVDQLVTDLQAAYTSEADPAKLKALTEIMGGVVTAAKASGTVTTTKQLQDKVHLATDLAVGVGKLPNTRKAIGAYLVTKLGNTSQPMTDAVWQQAAIEYATVATALGKVK